MVPLLKPFMRVFDHDDGGIHHRSDGYCNPSQRHNVGIQPLEVHNNEGDTQAKWQRNNRHQGRTDMPEEQCANDSNNDKLFKKLVTEVVNRAID